jgi:hypothetical protein
VKDDTSELAKHIRGKWFEPIISRIEAFEDKIDLWEEIQSVAEPRSPEWAMQCVIKAIQPFGELAGIPFNGDFGAREVGAMVGAKASMCNAMANAHLWAQRWSADGRAKFVSIWGKDGLDHALVTWKKFATELQPEFEDIRRFAVELAMRQGWDDVEFLSGVTKGLTFMKEVRKTIRKAVTKAERDAQNRGAVYFFAVSSWETIEANREQLSWPELAQQFEEKFEYQIGIDEDAFKKILQRCGLRIGKPGRRIPVGR